MTPTDSPNCETCGKPMTLATGIEWFCKTCPFEWPKREAPDASALAGEPEFTPEQLAELQADFDAFMAQKREPQQRIAALEAANARLMAERDEARAALSAIGVEGFWGRAAAQLQEKLNAARAERDAALKRFEHQAGLAIEATEVLTTLRTKLEGLPRYNCDCLPNNMQGQMATDDEARWGDVVACERWVVLADDLAAVLKEGDQVARSGAPEQSKS